MCTAKECMFYPGKGFSAYFITYFRHDREDALRSRENNFTWPLFLHNQSKVIHLQSACLFRLELLNVLDVRKKTKQKNEPEHESGGKSRVQTGSWDVGAGFLRVLSHSSKAHTIDWLMSLNWPQRVWLRVCFCEFVCPGTNPGLVLLKPPDRLRSLRPQIY